MIDGPEEGASTGAEPQAELEGEGQPVTIKDLLKGGRLKRTTVTDRVAAQAELGFVLEEGETPLLYRDIAKMEKANELLSGRYLIKESRVHANKVHRILKAELDDYNGARQRLENSVTPEEVAASAQVPNAKVVEYERAVQELGMLVAGVRLPSPFTDKMMPVKGDKHPNNEDGLAAIQQALGPLWEGNKDDKKKEE